MSMKLSQLESLKKTDRKRQYVKYLEARFKIKDSLGRVYQYRALPYQREWHSHFYLVDPEGPNRIWHKGRGVGATAITMMDLIVLGSRFDNLKIPVSSVTRDGPQLGVAT